MEQTEIIQSEEVIQFLSFSVSNEVFGIELVHVHEILRPVFITRIPNVEEYILGVVNLQGFIEINKNTRIVVLEHNSKRFGLVVEEVKQVIKIVKSSISGINNHMSSSFNNMIDYVGRSGETIVLIIELKKLINFE